VFGSHVVLLQALLALQAPVTPPPAIAGDSIILWFRSNDAAAIDSRALLDAVGVYTRDLGLAVRSAAEARSVPADAPAATGAAAILRAQGARLGFWCELRPGADVAVLTVVAPDAHLEIHLVERTGAHEAEQYRAIALKLRSVLVGTATPERLPPRPPPAAPPAAPPPVTAPAADLRVGARQPAAPAHRLFLSVAYQISTTVDSPQARHALAVDGALAFARPFEVHAGSELATRLDQQSNGDTISVFDLPLGVGARLVWRGPRFTVAAGPFAALHLVWASASGTDSGVAQSASVFNLAGGGGAEAIVRARVSARLAAELRVFGEIPVPTTHYSLRYTEVLAFGARVGAGLGLVFPTP
jgi:hypothetical protein